MSKVDPYAGMLLEMQEQAAEVQPPGWCLGRVMDIGPGRLVIQANGLQLDQEDLLVNPSLLAGYEEPFEIRIDLIKTEGALTTLDIGGRYVKTFIQVGLTTITSIPLYELPGDMFGIIRGKLSLKENRLKIGDQVVLLPDQEGQIYYVICKAVQV
jgi:hypothetical protein